MLPRPGPLLGYVVLALWAAASLGCSPAKRLMRIQPGDAGVRSADSDLPAPSVSPLCSWPHTPLADCEGLAAEVRTGMSLEQCLEACSQDSECARHGVATHSASEDTCWVGAPCVPSKPGYMNHGFGRCRDARMECWNVQLDIQAHNVARGEQASAATEASLEDCVALCESHPACAARRRFNYAEEARRCIVSEVGGALRMAGYQRYVYLPTGACD